MSTKSEPPQVIYLKFSELTIDPSHSGRSEKEIKANAKELAPLMSARGEWDAMQPGQFFTDESGAKHLLAGFTRVAAAQSLEWKGGYFFENADAPVIRRYAFLTTNAGKPISLFEQGRVFAEDYNGVVADDFKGALADKKKPEDWKVQPASYDDIGNRVGKSGEHIRKCILIFESSPEIAELLTKDKISPKIIPTASAWSKGDDAKQLRILKAAIVAADGEKATSKHMDLIKERFAPLKVASKKNGDDKGAGDGKGDSGDDKGAGGEKDDSGDDKGAGGEKELDLGTPAQPQPKPPTQKETNTIRESAIAVLAKFDAEVGLNSLDDTDLGGMVDALVEAGLIVTHLAAQPF